MGSADTDLPPADRKPRPASGTIPSVKGTTLSFLVDEVHAGLDSACLTRAQIEALSGAAQALLRTTVSRTRWYPIALYEELAEFLAKTSGGDRVEYLRELGERIFQRLQHGTTYQQMEYARGVEARREVGTKLRDSRLITSMVAAVLNFSQWEPVPDPKSPRHIVIQVTDAAHLPDAFRLVTEGLQTGMNRSINPSARAVRSEWVGRDRIIFRTNGPKPSQRAATAAG